MATVSKTYSFDAAHQLHGHNGKCARPHGHTYSVTVTCEGPIKPVKPADETETTRSLADTSDSGMVVDFYEMDLVFKPFIHHICDHYDLNETLVGIPRTTAELIACVFFGVGVAAKLPVVHVSVSETPNSAANVEEADWHQAGKPYEHWSAEALAFTGRPNAS